VIRANVAGIDIGAQEHFVCAPPGPAGEPNVRVFGATTGQLEAIADWLKTQGVESVAMESTGVYWIALYDLLETRGFEVVLVNARHLHNVPGRKTDMQDCQWIQLLHSCGLLRGSHRPDEQICALRTLRRQCANLVEERSKVVQWMQKSLDQMNVRVHRAVSDLMGKTGMEIVRAIVAGERDPKGLAQHRDPRCRSSVEEIAEHLRGTWREEHVFTLAMSLRHYDALEEMIADYEAQIARRLRALQPPERRALSAPAHPKPDKHKVMRRHGEEDQRADLWRLLGADLTRIDGICCATALTIATEIGPDVSTFPDEHHFVSWLRLSPFTPKSGGKPLRGKKAPKGATYAASALRMAAATLRHSRSALGAAYRRISRRHGPGIATFATARTLAKLIYRMLRYGHQYVDIGADAYEERFKRRRLLNLKSNAHEMGYELVPLAG
jgi:transposase